MPGPRSLDSTGVTHNVQGAPGFNSLGFADDLSLYVGNERDGNTLLAIVKKFEDWSRLKISIAKSFVTGALLQKRAERRLTESKRQEKKNETTMRQDVAVDCDMLLTKLAVEEGETDSTESPRHDPIFKQKNARDQCYFKSPKLLRSMCATTARDSVRHILSETVKQAASDTV